MKTRSTVEIRAAPSAVFPYLYDPEWLARWLTDFLSASRSLDAPAGAELTMTFRQMGGGTREAATMIVATEPGCRLAYRMVDPSFEIEIEFFAEPAGALTRLTQTLVATARTEAMAAMARQAESMAAQQHQRDLEKLKALVEAGERGREEGLQEGLLESVEALCSVLEIELFDERRRELASLDAGGLAALLARLQAQRRWA